jgi:hypothetical protein
MTIKDHGISRRNWPTVVDSLRFATLTVQEMLSRNSSVNYPNAITRESLGGFRHRTVSIEVQNFDYQ